MHQGEAQTQSAETIQTHGTHVFQSALAEQGPWHSSMRHSDVYCHINEHPWREACGPCSIEREDMPTIGRIAASLTKRGT